MPGSKLSYVLLLTVLAFAAVSWALTYFFPAPPSTVTIATAFKGASFDYYGRRYRERFALAKVNLELRATKGALDNLKLLKDPGSGVQIAFVTGGVAEPDTFSGILSLGTIDYLPIWLFYVSGERLENLSQLKGKRIAVGLSEVARDLAPKKYSARVASVRRMRPSSHWPGTKPRNHCGPAKWTSCGYSAPRKPRPFNRCCAVRTSGS